MGNCLRHQSSSPSFSDYDDHYWDDFSAAKSFETSPSSSTKSKKKNNNNSIDYKTKTTITTTTEVKIKITKKQLAELLGKEMRVEQVLVQLLAQSHHHGYDVSSLHRPWRPVLQSIPEVN